MTTQFDIKQLLQKPIAMMTGEELTFLLNSSMEAKANEQTPVVQKRTYYGIEGIAQVFGCSVPTANRIKRSGIIDAAITQIGRKMIVDAGGDIDLAPGEYAWPTASNWELSDKYGWRRCPFHGREFHNGLDIVLTSGTNGSPVYAIADGYVTRASWYGGYGNCIQYAVGNGYSVLYGHLSGYNCKAGQYVTKGSVLGYIGSTGASTGPHLHFTVFQNGSHINPFSLY